MVRRIIKIDESACNGCGACAAACHEGAIEMVNGRARLMRDDYCDGLGDCLPACPTGAISFEQREAAEYDEVAVRAAREEQPKNTLPCGCPGTAAHAIKRDGAQPAVTECAGGLNQWPVQIKLLPTTAPYYDNAELLIAADCTAYAYADFHARFIKNSITLIGCPKLDEGDYTAKLQSIIEQNNIKSLTIVRMEVPCCGGLEAAARSALQQSGRFIPWRVVTISTDGRIV